MKKQLSKVFAIVVMFLATSVNVSADTDKVVEVSQLPAQAQQILKQHFAQKKVAIAKSDWDWFSKGYDVVFTDGCKVEFDGNGNWTNIDCRRSTVPVKLIPTQILTKVQEMYPSITITEIERDRRGYDVSLSNGLDLEFNTKFQVVDVDK